MSRENEKEFFPKEREESRRVIKCQMMSILQIQSTWQIFFRWAHFGLRVIWSSKTTKNMPENANKQLACVIIILLSFQRLESISNQKNYRRRMYLALLFFFNKSKPEERMLLIKNHVVHTKLLQMQDEVITCMKRKFSEWSLFDQSLDSMTSDLRDRRKKEPR